MQSQEASNLITIPKLLFREGDGREGDGSMEQKSIIPKVYTHIFCVSHPNGFAKIADVFYVRPLLGKKNKWLDCFKIEILL